METGLSYKGTIGWRHKQENWLDTQKEELGLFTLYLFQTHNQGKVNHTVIEKACKANEEIKIWSWYFETYSSTMEFASFLNFQQNVEH